MKKIFILICLFFLIGFAKAENNLIKQSVWAWEVNSKFRKIYILGELHQFTIKKDLAIVISHDLGGMIYDLSAETWIESQQTLQTNVPISQKLSSQLKSETWEKVKKGFKRATDSMSHWELHERNNLLKQYINNLDQQDPFNAYTNLFRFADAGKNSQRIDRNIIQGLNTTLSNHEKSSGNLKLKIIENTQSIADTWWQNCNDKNKAEILITEALKWQNRDYNFDNDSDVLTQLIFLKDENNIDIFNSDFVNTTSSDKIISECILIPRTKNWMPKILDSLSTEGPPIAYLIGIGHIGGKEGILSLLQEKGYSDMKRIYSIK
jgi:uncharacterized protein YbaP (TraB family)